MEYVIRETGTKSEAGNWLHNVTGSDDYLLFSEAIEFVAESAQQGDTIVEVDARGNEYARYSYIDLLAQLDLEAAFDRGEYR